MFEPSILKWAREKRLGPTLEALSAKLQESWKEATVEQIQSWESGSAYPSFTEVKKLAVLYKRPLAVFFLDSPPSALETPPDRRTIGSKDNKDISPEGLLVIRKARRIQEISESLYEELGEKSTFKYPKYSINDDPVELADKVRADLGISVIDQFKFSNYSNFFEHLRAKIESTGIITLKSGLHDSFPIEDCRAFSFADVQPYLILVNNKDFEGPKNFSLAHELAHILVRSAGLCNNFKTFDVNGRRVDQLEVFCNKFAANFLVPKDALLSHRLLRERSKINEDEADGITERIALDFKVSKIVMLRRLQVLNLVSDKIYKEKAKKWGDETPSRPKDKGGRYSLKTVLQKNGRAFSNLVLEAYQQKKISYTGVSDYLGLKRKHIQGLESLLHSNGR